MPITIIYLEWHRAGLWLACEREVGGWHIHSSQIESLQFLALPVWAIVQASCRQISLSLQQPTLYTVGPWPDLHCFPHL